MNPFAHLKKSQLLACLVASSTTGPALAQSSVTLYGVLDTAIDISNNGFGTLTRMGPGGSVGSRLGFTGKEELGGGWAAIFTLENGFGVTDGALQQGGLLFGRQAFVGVQSDRLGALTFGRQYSPEWWSFTQNDPHNLGLAAGLQALAETVTVGGVKTTRGLLGAYTTTVRVNNSIVYTSPTISGLLVRLMYGVGGVPGSVTAGQTTSAMFQYAIYNLEARAGIVHMEDTDGAGGYEAINGGAAYRISQVKVSFDYEYDKNSSSYTAGSSIGRVQRYSLYNLAMSYYPTPACRLVGGVTKLVNTSDNLPESQNTFIYSLAAYYSLSKRTTLYADYAQLKNRGGSALSLGGALYTGSIAAPNATSRTFQVGVKTYF
ncbi:porin [Paraburkholderia strydomiana]|uniref:porin n=1 Tax=Paraburkholderia strydomiana TaxID=1245417 RepID=UPI001BE63095|nr:porin [Paraburkholderia strydomiana]MBT2793572.1 porin [Paraburkholderia strydomiana]